MKLCPEIKMVPVMHGKEMFAGEVRRICSERKFDCIVVDIPQVFQDSVAEAVDGLPLVSALIARKNDVYGGGGVNVAVCISGDDSDDEFGLCYYLPIDPCDSMIEGIRQARQRRIPFYCVGAGKLKAPAPLPSMPDDYSIKKIGFDAYTALCCATVAASPADIEELTDAQRIAGKLKTLRGQYDNILAIVHLRHIEAVKCCFRGGGGGGDGIKDVEDYSDLYDGDEGAYTVTKRYINPDHLYFALGELPFIAAKTQMERHDPFALPLDLTDAVKDLFRETRDNYSGGRDQVIKLSPVRIQTALTYLRNLTVMSRQLIPSLFDIIEAAKGVGGNSYALNILKSAKYYPFLPIESGDEAIVNVGIDRISLVDDGAVPGMEKMVYGAVNLFRDTEVSWRKIDIKPDPSELQKTKYRYTWNNRGLCSHLPEDARIENFNSHARNKAMRIVTEHLARTEKFTSSVKDGIDIRETLRNWHTGSIYVKEIPPSTQRVDTVIIIFDEDHDDRYPQQATWYAEHEAESTLSFYATGLFDDLIGPGIARCAYGGLALLFPPRYVPDVFHTAGMMGIDGCAAQLVAGSLMFGKEKNVAYISAKAPSLRIRTLSSRFKKHLVWIPLSTFSTETLNRLRHFHVLNGKDVRSWAPRFIGDLS